MRTKRGARTLVYRGHRYVVNRRGHDGRIFWRCGKSRSCSGSITTLDDRIVSQREDHNHAPDEGEIKFANCVIYILYMEISVFYYCVRDMQDQY